MEIRNAVSADAGPLSQLAISTFSDAFAKDNTPEDLAKFFAQNYTETHQRREIADPDLATLVAEHDGTLVAFAQVQTNAPNEALELTDCAELRRLYVDKAWHGRGLAQELVHAARKAARQGGANTLWLGVWEHNARAIAFYKKLGFRVIGKKTFRLGDDLQRDLVMTSPLNTV